MDIYQYFSKFILDITQKILIGNNVKNKNNIFLQGNMINSYFKHLLYITSNQ